MLKIQNLSVNYGPRRILHDISLNVQSGEVLALIGKLNADPAVNGILVQLPLPKQIDAQKRRARVAVHLEHRVADFAPAAGRHRRKAPWRNRPWCASKAARRVI